MVQDMVNVLLVNVVVKMAIVEQQKSFVLPLKVVNPNLEIANVVMNLVHVLLVNVATG